MVRRGEAGSQAGSGRRAAARRWSTRTRGTRGRPPVRHLRPDPHRHGRRLLRRADQLRDLPQPDPPRVRPELHERLLPREGGLRVPRRAVQRLRPRQAHLRHRDVGVRGRSGGHGRVRADPEGDRRPRTGAADQRGPRRVDHQARHAARASAQRLPAHEGALLPLHAGGGVGHHRHPEGSVPRDLQAGRRDGPARQGHDDRVRGRPHAPHHRRPAHPERRPAPAVPRQHGAAGRRHERRARPRQHPGQHRPRDLVGDPARVPAHPRARPEEPERLRAAERAQEVRRELVELLRHQLPELHGQPPQGLVRRRGDGGERVRVRVRAEARVELLVDLDLRPGAEGQDGGRHPLRDDRHQHRAGLQPGHGGPREAQVARRHGPSADDELRVLAAAGRGPEDHPDRGLHGPDDPLDREGRVLRQQRPMDAVEGCGDPARRRRPGTTTGSWPTSTSA